jgi:hypothetical protein
MKTVLTVLIAGVLAFTSGCAAGTDESGTGDTNLSTDQGGTVAQDPNADQIPAPEITPPTRGQAVDRVHSSQFDPGAQVIPNRPSHGPASPNPGPEHLGPVQPR